MLYLTALLLLYAPSAFAWLSPPCDTVSSSTTEATPQDVNYTVGTTSTANRVAIAQLTYRGEGAGITGVTFDGGAMTQIGTTAVNATPNPDFGAALFIMTGVTSGTFTVSASFTGSPLQSTVTVYTCYGVDQVTPVRGGSPVSTGNASVTTSVSINVSSASGDMVIDAVSAGSLGAGLAPTVDGSQTVIYSCVANGIDNHDACGSTEPGAGTVTMSWTSGTNVAWAAVGASLVPAGSTARNRGAIILP